MKKAFAFILFTAFAFCAFSQQRQDIKDYVAQYKDIALEEMVKAGIPASITLAQGILESSIGKSPLATKANNHFGIKCKSDWTGERFFQTDDAPDECFRVYSDSRESYADHSNFLRKYPRYAALFELSPFDYKGWAQGLKDAGYATNPKYPSLLIGYIETYQLHEYDKTGMAMIEQQKSQPEMAREPVPSTIPVPPVATTIENNTPTPVANTPAPVVQNEPVGTAVKTNDVLTVNGLKVVKAVGNEDPFTVAFNHQIDYKNILAFNDLDIGEHFKDGEYVYLQAKKTRGASATYIVKQGESMRDISQKTGIKVRELYLKNLMVMNEQAKPGETLNLQEKRPVAPQTMSYGAFLRSQTTATHVQGNAAPAIKNISKYEVQKSDTLYSIAQKFNTTVEQIKQTNGLNDNALTPGQTIVITQ